MPQYRTFKAEQKVRSIFGKTYTVLSQTGCMVFVAEMSSGHIHPSKIWAI
jgi:hypothetical protein